MESEYCFAVTWDDDDKAGAYVIKATSRDEAWAKLCVSLSDETLDRVTGIELQFVNCLFDNRSLCPACGERLGANPVRLNDEYYHEECI